MRILFFGTYDEERHPRVRVLREGLIDAGFEVDVLNCPLGDSTAVRVSAGRNPVTAIKWLVGLAAAWKRLLLDSRGHAPPDVIMVGYLGVLDIIIARLRWPRCRIALDHMAPLRGVARDRGFSRLVTALFSLLDRVAETLADLVVYDTEENASLANHSEGKRLVVPVGAAREWFDAGARRVRHATPVRVVFFGLYTPLQGAATIGRAIAALRDDPIEFTMIGGGQDLGLCRQLAGDAPRVEWIDWLEGSLPEVVAGHHICLGIFGTTPKAERVVPNKVFQGAAAGCAVVTLDSEAQRRAMGIGAIYVRGGDHQALVSSLRRLAADPTDLERRRVQALAASRAFEPVAVASHLTVAFLQEAPQKHS